MPNLYSPNMKIVGMMKVFNEDDIISETIENLINQKIDLVILDNGSTDRTYEICQEYERKGHVKLIQSFENPFESFLIFRILYDLTLTLSPDWIIRVDADEFFESGQNNLSLRDGICMVDEEGYNLIQFNRFDFFMTDDDNDSEKSIKNRLKYYSYQNDHLYRAWKFIPGILGGEGGHVPIFPKGVQYKIFPKKFAHRHYPYRSKFQAEKKVKAIEERILSLPQNTPTTERFQKVLQHNFSERVDHMLLTKYHEDNHWCLERKYTPFVIPNQPKREDIFSSNGFLLKGYPDRKALQIVLQKRKDQIKELERENANLKERNQKLEESNQKIKKL